MVISNFLLLPSVFVAFSRLDSFDTISTQRILYVSRLFLVSLVPWIDKLWGNTLREKLHDPCACGIQIGALRSVNTTLYPNVEDYEGPIGLSPPTAYLYKSWDIRQTKDNL